MSDPMDVDDFERRQRDLWIGKIAMQYGCRQAAALRGDEFAVKVADFWLAQSASGHWHEIIAACRSGDGRLNPEVRPSKLPASETEPPEGRCKLDRAPCPTAVKGRGPGESACQQNGICQRVTMPRETIPNLIDDLASMIRRLGYALKRSGTNDKLVHQAVEMLKRFNLGGSILREQDVDQKAGRP